MDYNILIPKVIEAGKTDPNALSDALEMCKALERINAVEVEDKIIHDKANFALAHEFSKQIREVAKQLIRQNYKSAVETYKRSLLFDAPYDFDSYCIYIEWNREPRKQFYLPRRKQLLPIVRALQDLEDGKLEILGISMPPGVGKSALALFYLSWVSGKHPDMSNLSGSHNNAFLNGIYNEMLRILDPKGEYLWHDVFPQLMVISTNAKDLMIDIADDKNKGKRFTTLEFTSIGSQNAGKVRAQNLLYCDDLVDGIETALSKDRLDKLWQMYHTDLRQRKQGDCRELHIATRWSVHDVLGRLEAEYEGSDKVKFIRSPALDENGESNFDYPYGLGFTTEMYSKQKDIMDEASWDALYMNSPVERNGLLYEQNELRYYFTLPDREPDAIVSTCDIADNGGDSWSMPIAYQYGTDFYIDGWIFDNGKPDVVEERIIDALVRRNVQMSCFESNRGGTRVAESVQKRLKERGAKTRITTKWNNTSKLTRCIVASAFVKEHFLFKDKSIQDKEYAKAYKELTTFTMTGKNKHDDACDGLAQLADFVDTLHIARISVMKRPF